MPFSSRHAFHDRPPGDNAHSPQKHRKNKASHLQRDKEEELAEKIMSAGAVYVTNKYTERYTDEEMPQGPSAAASTGAGVPDPHHLANKIIKEGAREIQRHEGSSSEDAMAAQAVLHARNDPSAPAHVVVERIIEKIAGAEEHADHHTFQGPNPDKGRDRPNEKLRHHRTDVSTPFVTGGFKKERNPDVLH